MEKQVSITQDNYTPPRDWFWLKFGIGLGLLLGIMFACTWYAYQHGYVKGYKQGFMYFLGSSDCTPDQEIHYDVAK